MRLKIAYEKAELLLRFHCCIAQGIIDCKGTETLVCNGKKIRKLFVSTLNGITVSVRCVSFMVVVLDAKLIRLIAAHANKKDGEKRRNPTRVPFFAS